MLYKVYSKVNQLCIRILPFCLKISFTFSHHAALRLDPGTHVAQGMTKGSPNCKLSFSQTSWCCRKSPRWLALLAACCSLPTPTSSALRPLQSSFFPAPARGSCALSLSLPLSVSLSAGTLHLCLEQHPPHHSRGLFNLEYFPRQNRIP